MQNKWLSLEYDGSWPSAESLPVGRQLRRLVLSASDKLRVTTLDSAGHKGSVFPQTVLHGTLHFLGSRNSVCLGCACVCFVEVDGCVTR